MPNYCNYTMKVYGKKENVQSFINIMEAEYYYNENDIYVSCEEQRHFFRIFDTYYDEEELKQAKDNENISIMIDGTCAWSVEVCMNDGGYYKDIRTRYKEKAKGTTLQDESKTLDLIIEVYSEEIGVGFQEHYLYDRGVKIYDECVDYEELYDEETEEIIGYKGGFEWNFCI